MNRAKSPYLSLEKKRTTVDLYMHLLHVWQCSDYFAAAKWHLLLFSHEIISIFLLSLLLLLLLLYFNGNVVSHEFACAVIMADVVIFCFCLVCFFYFCIHRFSWQCLQWFLSRAMCIFVLNFNSKKVSNCLSHYRTTLVNDV